VQRKRVEFNENETTQFYQDFFRGRSGVYHVEIEARRQNSCSLMNPWPGKQVTVREVGNAKPVPTRLDTSNGECVTFNAQAGHKYVVLPSKA
jgi:hypothetical protein